MRLRHPQSRRAMLALMGLVRAPIADPAETQMAHIETLDVLPFFGDPVAENLTGLPARVYAGETANPQHIVSAPTLAQIDPVVGISPSGAGRYPSLPSRRPPANTPVP